MLDVFPDEIVSSVLRYLRTVELVNLSASSSEWHMRTLRASLNLFSYKFRADLSDPKTILPDSKRELFQIITADDTQILIPFSFACATGCYQFVELVLKRTPKTRIHQLVESCTEEGFTPLILACKNNRLFCAKTLLQYSSNVMSQDNSGRSALWYAIQGCFHEVVKELLESGVVESQSILAALFEAVYVSKASIDSQSRCLRTLSFRFLHDLESKSLHYLRKTVDHECDEYIRVINACLIAHSRATLLRILLAPLNELQVARSLILRSCVRVNSPLILAARRCAPEFIEALLESGLCTVSDKTLKSRKTALYVAAENGNYDCVKALLNAKALVGTVTSSGRNCLHVAVERGHSDIVELLCENATAQDVEQTNSGGVTPYHLAVNRGRLKMAQAMQRCCRRTTPSGRLLSRIPPAWRKSM